MASFERERISMPSLSLPKAIPTASKFKEPINTMKNPTLITNYDLPPSPLLAVKSEPTISTTINALKQNIIDELPLEISFSSDDEVYSHKEVPVVQVIPKKRKKLISRPKQIYQNGYLGKHFYLTCSY